MFDDALRKLNDLARRAQQLEGKQSVPVAEILDDDFMLRNTDFPSADAMFAASGFTINTAEDFAAVPDDKWDAFIADRTVFDSWEAMLKCAGEAWAARQLGLD